MRPVNSLHSFRYYATAVSLLLGLLVVALWAAVMLADGIHAEAEPEFSTTTDEFTFARTSEGGAPLPATVLLNGSLSSWLALSKSVIL